MPQSFQLYPDDVYRVPEFEQFEWLEHGFTTRHTTDWPDLDRLATAKQIHSTAVLPVLEGAGHAGSGDALVTDRPGVLLGVRTADCVPILLVDPRNRAVAAIHAGWRGTVQRIARCTISELVARFGTTPAELYAAMGPSIGECCYEVGPEVAQQFVRWLPELGAATGRVKLNLEKVNRRQLLEAGVRADCIFTGAPCTSCTVDTCHSFRRDGEQAGRMLACIGVRGNG